MTNKQVAEILILNCEHGMSYSSGEIRKPATRIATAYLKALELLEQAQSRFSEYDYKFSDQVSTFLINQEMKDK